ncbi:MAG: hypothetical protein QXG46_03415 [Ignisphaera sp.]
MNSLPHAEHFQQGAVDTDLELGMLEFSVLDIEEAETEREDTIPEAI